MKAIIPVAGIGLRMRPHTHSQPKPIFPLAGKPGISYLLDDLLGIGVSEFIFITGHLKENFEAFIRKNYSFNARFIEQKTLDGTAGAIRLAEPYVDGPVIIAFADGVFEADMHAFSRLKHGESGIIWTKPVEDYQRFGVCVIGEDGYLQKIVEKPGEPISKLANVGLYYVKDYKLLFEGINYVFDSGRTIKGEYFLTDAFEYMIGRGAKFLCPEVSGWFDYGKPETALESNKALLERNHTTGVIARDSTIIQPVFVAPGVVIDNSTIGPFVSISAGSTVIGSTLKDSIVGQGVRIEDSSLEKSLIGDCCELKGCRSSVNLGAHSVVKQQD